MLTPAETRIVSVEDLEVGALTVADLDEANPKLIVETSANRFYRVRGTGDPNLSHVWFGFEVKKTKAWGLHGQEGCPRRTGPQGWLAHRGGDLMTEEQIKHMVDRFLMWRLPENFSPDAGISFKPTFNEHTAHPMRHEPVGTNLFDAQQAEAMVRHMIEDLPQPEDLLALVRQQAEDAGLWFVAKTAPEAYLQQELRRLHSAIEGRT